MVPIGKANSSNMAPIIINILPQFLPVRNAIANMNESKPENIKTTPRAPKIPPKALPPENPAAVRNAPPTNTPISKSIMEKINCIIPNMVTPAGLFNLAGGTCANIVEPQLGQYMTPFCTIDPHSWQYITWLGEGFWLYSRVEGGC